MVQYKKFSFYWEPETAPLSAKSKLGSNNIADI